MNYYITSLNIKNITLEENMRMLKLVGADIVILNVFSRATPYPSEQTYHFSKLDKIMKLVTKNEINICLAASTGPQTF